MKFAKCDSKTFAIARSVLIVGVLLGFSSAQAAFVPLGAVGPAVTDWEYEAPAGFSIADASVSISGDATSSLLFKLGGTFSSFDPVTVTFRTTKKRAEQYFFMNLDMKNMTDVPWKGFQIEVSDFYEAVAGAAFHPSWAHVHPGAAASSYAPFTTLVPSTGAGKPGVIAKGGGTIAVGNSWLPTKIRLHDGPIDESAEEFLRFDLILTPVPEPSTIVAGGFLLLPALLQGYRHYRNRRRAA